MCELLVTNKCNDAFLFIRGSKDETLSFGICLHCEHSNIQGVFFNVTNFKLLYRNQIDD